MPRKYNDVWSGRLGIMNITKHWIDLIPGALPFKSAPYQAVPKKPRTRTVRNQQATQSQSHRTLCLRMDCPVLFALKKDRKLRYCVEYHNFNTITIKDSWNLPRMEESIDLLGEPKLLTTLDAYDGYWQVSIAPKIVKKRHSFVTPAPINTYGCPSN